MQVTATRQADSTKSGGGTAAITSDIALSLAPNPASVELGATQLFQATLASSGHPDTSVRWSLWGPACASACGTVDASGKYTAPPILPSPASATLTAQSVADPSNQTLAANPSAYDLESLLTHEFGHFLGFSHSAVWSAIMHPFAAAPGTFSGMRPTAQQPDGPLGDDDRTGLRVLYPDPTDTVHQGSISGQVFPANPLALPASPPGVTGVFGAQVVAVDTTTGAWWEQPLADVNGVVDPSQIIPAIDTLCRNATTDAGWPLLQGCVVPAADTSFTTRTLPGP